MQAFRGAMPPSRSKYETDFPSIWMGKAATLTCFGFVANLFIYGRKAFLAGTICSDFKNSMTESWSYLLKF